MQCASVSINFFHLESSNEMQPHHRQSVPARFQRPHMKLNSVEWKKAFAFINIFIWELSLADFFLALPQSRTVDLAITSHKCCCTSPHAYFN